PLTLERQEVLSQRNAAQTRVAEAEAQTRVLEAQLETALEQHARTRRLFEQSAATARELDQHEGEVRVLRARITAARAHAGATREEIPATDARVEQIEDRIRRSRIVNPITGTVLAAYAEAGEFVQPGQPLYRIADLDTLVLRAYVSGAQLSGLRLGQSVLVRIDAADGELLEMAGRIGVIASEAEFTPTPIQTRDERTEQVYAVEVTVPNTGGLAKIGMPGEVLLQTQDGPRDAAQ
ncbi:MAG: HlyD family efflux transporter periplasmic adaptor subunit, partial [Gemmatimonadota bacterium]